MVIAEYFSPLIFGSIINGFALPIKGELLEILEEAAMEGEQEEEREKGRRRN